MAKDNTSLNLNNKMFEIEAVLSLSEPLPAVDVWLVLDFLRASTSIVTWFELGGKEIYPEVSIDAAFSLKRKMFEEGISPSPLLMGEKNSVPPEGFDAGNSPLEIDKRIVSQHPTAIIVTSNGTRAILKAVATGAAVYVVCARNALYALDSAVAQGRRIGIMCAGRLDRPAVDDTLCAGLIIEKLCCFLHDFVLSDVANIALKAWKNSTGSFENNIRTSVHAKFLEKIGFSDDIGYACEQDAAVCVPEVKEVSDFCESGLRARITCENKGGLSFLSRDAAIRRKGANVRRRKTIEAGDIFFGGDSYTRDKTHAGNLNLDFGGKGEKKF